MCQMVASLAVINYLRVKQLNSNLKKSMTTKDWKRINTSSDILHCKPQPQ